MQLAYFNCKLDIRCKASKYTHCALTDRCDPIAQNYLRARGAHRVGFGLAVAAIIMLYVPDPVRASISPLSTEMSSVTTAFLGVFGALLGFVIAGTHLSVDILIGGKFRDILIESDFCIKLRVDFCWTSVLIGACFFVFGVL